MLRLIHRPNFILPRFQHSSLRFFTGASTPRGANFKSPVEISNIPLPNFQIADKNEASFYRPFYLDNQATTPVDPRVIDKMLPLYTDAYGNPHSRSHSFGWEAEDHVENSRKQVADLIGALPKNIIFTSGATESNNMAIKGTAEFYYKATKGQKNHIITAQTEHKCVLQSCRNLQQNGYEVTFLPVKPDGLIDMNDLEEAIQPGKTLLCSVMFVNNEIGVIQDLKSIGKLCRKNKVFFHTDAAQGVGKLPINVDEMNIDLLSISGHKLYGPKGVGALYIRSKPRIRLSPIIDGGGQERGFRSGTLPAPIIAGFGEACSIAKEEMEADHQHITKMYNVLRNGIKDKVPFITINGSESERYSGNLNISFAYIEGESMIMALKNFAVSSGSACTSASLEPSYVLRAIGVDEALAHTSLRFGIGRFTTEDEVNQCIDGVVKEADRLREMSPLYEIALEEKETGVKQSMVWT